MSQQTTSPCPSDVWRSPRFPATGPYEAEAVPAFSTIHTGKTCCGHRGNVNRTTFNLANNILECWAGTPLLLGSTNRAHRPMRVGAAQRELARDKGARFLPPGYSYVDHHTWTRRFSGTTLPVGAYICCMGQDCLWWLG